jgi:hypothetical protein
MMEWQTGDLILLSFDRHTYWHAPLVQLFLRSPWNHVGICLVDPVTKEPYLFEMLSRGLTRLVSMYDVQKRTSDVIPGKYVKRTLQGTTPEYIQRAQSPAFWKAIRDLYLLARFNNASLWHWIHRFMPSLDPFRFGAKRDGADVFTCAQLVLWIYALLGIVDPKDILENETGFATLLPPDFALNEGGQSDAIGQTIRLQPPFSFGPLMPF